MSDVPSGLVATRWSSQILSYSVRPIWRKVLRFERKTGHCGPMWRHKPRVRGRSSRSGRQRAVGGRLCPLRPTRQWERSAALSATPICQVKGAAAAMDVVLDTRRGMLERAAALKDSEPNFARFMLAMVNATETDDLSRYSPSVLEAMLRKTYTRLGKREGRSHVIYEFPPDDVMRAELIEVFSADMPFIVDSVLAAIRAKGGVIRFMSHPVLHLDPESHRLLDDAAPVSVNESLLLVQIEQIQD